MRAFLLLLLSLLLFACEAEPPIEMPKPDPVDSTGLQYLALGDSYTIGQNVEIDQRWPNQLATRLRIDSIDIKDPLIVARTGWTTSQLLSQIEASADIAPPYDLVSLAIGVNNQFSGYPISLYKQDLQVLLSKSIFLADGHADRVFVLSIPDYGLTPFGQGLDPERIARELDLYNALADSICKVNGVAFYDITEVSRKYGEFPEYVANDNLHPSGKMYKLWVDEVYEAVKNLVK